MIKILLVPVFFFALSLRAEPEIFRVLSFNTYLLNTPFGIQGAPDVNLRLTKIADDIIALAPDIVTLQEVWKKNIQNSLIAAIKNGGYQCYRSDNFTLVGGYSNGLIICSKFEFIALKKPDAFLDFKIQTRADEDFTNKGAIRVKLKTPGNNDIDIITTHLGAISFNTKKKSFDADHVRSQEKQADKLKHWIHGRTEPAPYLIVTGDMNRHPFAWDARKQNYSTSELSSIYKIFTHDLELSDSFLVASMRSNFFHWFIPHSAFGITFDNQHPYVSSGAFNSEPSGRIDYIFASDNFLIKNSSVLFKEFDESKKPVALSDHYGVMTTLQIK